MRVEGESIPAEVGEGNDSEPGETTTGHGAESETPSATADKFARIIEDAQSSTRAFLETVRTQSQSILEEAEEEARRDRAAMLEETQNRVDTLVATADEMLSEAERLRSSLEDVSMSLRESASRLRGHVDELVGSGDLHEDDDSYDDDQDGSEGDEADSEYAATNRRRFGLR